MHTCSGGGSDPQADNDDMTPATTQRRGEPKEQRVKGNARAQRRARDDDGDDDGVVHLRFACGRIKKNGETLGALGSLSSRGRGESAPSMEKEAMRAE